MLKIRRSEDRGLAQHGWLTSRHTFSFASYYDSEHMNFGPLRVINEDRIKGGTGFGQHPHRDMEIISYVMQGALRHQDSMGNTTVIRPGDVQRMSAGSGIMHSEHNDDAVSEAYFLQIWIIPNKEGVKPGYGQRSFAEELDTKNLVLVVSQDGRDESIPIHQDADIYISKLKAGEQLYFPTKPDRGYWLQVIKGSIEVFGERLLAGDALALSEEKFLAVKANEDAEMMLFDMIAG